MSASTKARLPSAVSSITSCIRTASFAAVSMVLRTKSVVLLPLSAAARSMSAFSSDARRNSSRLSLTVLAIALATSSTNFCLLYGIEPYKAKSRLKYRYPEGVYSELHKD
jgi:hypothetical protein